jgi:hypothetical protein
MTLEDPPYNDEIAIVADRQTAQKFGLPKLTLGWEFIRWFGTLKASVDQAPKKQAQIALSNQSASIALTPLPFTSLPSGLYRISYWMKLVVPAGTSSSLQFTLTWTRNGIVLTSTAAAIAGNTTSTYQFGTLVMRIDANAPISFSVAYASNAAGVARYELDVIGEALALDEAA